jgi:hypothetical protein
MGEIQQMPVTQDEILIQEPRESFLRSPPWTAWNEVRLGMTITFVPVGVFQQACTTETIYPYSYLDWVCWGLKDPSLNLPGQAGASFVGLGLGTTGVSNVLSNNASGTGNITCASNNALVSVYGTSVLTKSADTGTVIQFPQYSATLYCFTSCMRLVLNNSGLSNQTISAQWVQNTASLAGDYSVNKLRTDLFNSAYGSTYTLTWNSGGQALTLPYCWYLRMPFLLNRARISALAMFKVS